MNTDKREAKSTPAYVAHKTLTNFLRSLSQVVPSRIDKGVMRSMSGGVQSQLMHALRYLDLINANGIPTERLKTLVKAEGQARQAVMREILNSSYPFLAQKSLDLSTATHQQLEEEFRKLASGDTVRKCIGFFVPAAKDAGIPLSPYIREPGKRSAPATNSRAKKPPRVASKNGSGEPPADQKPPTPGLGPSWHEMLLSKFPNFDPAWPDEVKSNWFKAFNDLMQHGNKKHGA